MSITHYRIPLFNEIPASLRARRQHVIWKPQPRGNKIAKPAYIARAILDTGQAYHASSTNPKHWSTFPQAQKAYERGGFAGIGYVLTHGKLFVDLDHCLDANGAPNEAAQEILDALNSYSEYSPGDGIHIFTLGSLPPGAKNRYTYKGVKIELYDTGRYATLTGHRIAGTPADLFERQASIEALIERFEQWERENTSVVLCVLPSDQAPEGAGTRSQDEQATAPAIRNKNALRNEDQAARSAPPAISESDLPRDDQAILAKARAARNAATFTALWDGHDPKGRNNPSEADFDLVLMLLYWTNDDQEQTERLFRASGRYRAEKTDRRTTRSGHSYLQLTIYKAIKKRHGTRPSRKPDPEPPTPGPGTGQRAPARQDRRITHAHHWTRRQETAEERQEKLQATARRVAEQVERHIRSGNHGLLVANVAPGVGKSSTVAPLGERTSQQTENKLNLAWIAERRNMIDQVAALQFYRRIEPCTRHNCPDHHLHNRLGERGYNTWSVHKRHSLQCGYAQQFKQVGSAVYQLAHVATKHPANHQGIIIDELDISKWLPEREITIARLAAAARLYATGSTADLLLRTVAATITDAAQARQELHGQALFTALDQRAGGRLENWIGELAQDDHYVNTHPWHELKEDNPAALDEETASLAPVVLPHILVALIRELAKWQRGKAWNSCLRMGRGPQGWSLYITERRTFTPGEHGLPARAVLDATADAEILSRLFGEQITLEQADIEPPPGTRHIAIRTGKRYGKTALCTVRRDGSRPDLNRVIAEARYVIRELDPEGQAQAAQKIGLISFLGCVDAIGEALSIPEERRLHYWAARGSNALEDCTILLVIGTPTIAPATVARLARALWQNDPEPINTESAPDSQGIRRYTDKRVQRLNDFLTRSELTQCAHRSRALRAPRTVITFCLGEIDYLPATTTITELPQLTADGRERWKVAREQEQQRMEQARAELEQEGKTIAMLTVRELKAAAQVSTDAAADYLRTVRSETSQGKPAEGEHTHTHTSVLSEPQHPNKQFTSNPRYKPPDQLAPPGQPPEECQKPGGAPPTSGKPCARCGQVDQWARDERDQRWLCSCYYWWYEYPERRQRSGP